MHHSNKTLCELRTLLLIYICRPCIDHHDRPSLALPILATRLQSIAPGETYMTTEEEREETHFSPLGWCRRYAVPFLMVYQSSGSGSLLPIQVCGPRHCLLVIVYFCMCPTGQTHKTRCTWNTCSSEKRESHKSNHRACHRPELTGMARPITPWINLKKEVNWWASVYQVVS